MLESGTVVIIEGVFFVVEDYAEEGFWEDSEAMYVGSLLVPISDFTQHDREEGLPLCKLVTEGDWEEPIKQMWYEFTGELVLHEAPVYIKAAVLETWGVDGKLKEEFLMKARERRIKGLYDGTAARLTEEDNIHRYMLSETGEFKPFKG